MQWTEEQRRAIETRGSNILLSAAAGSGKTTVLVARVLKLIQSGEGQIDRMLVVTFTRAASADMRAKLSRELGRRATEGDERCRNQQLLLDRAAISTLHGFCSDFLRTHFESAGVDPDFRILDDAEVRRLTDEALDQAIEQAYTDPDEALNALDYARGPKGVRAMAEQLLRALEERPDPEAWLRRACNPDAQMRRAWQDEMCAAARREIDRALLLCRLALRHPGCNNNYAPALERDIADLEAMQSIELYSDFQRALLEFKQAPVGRKKGDGPIHEDVKRLRQDAKNALDKIALRNLELGGALQDVDQLIPQWQRLSEIVLNAREALRQRKAELSGLSYSDLEHCTLRALRDPDTARQLREKYDHIFVDEYQDTSDVQEALISCICRENNRFMVGDVKQSIYRFRQAEPRLFLEKYESYGRNQGGLLLPLTMNFRSRPAILDFTNHIFQRAMFGGESEITYDALARLNHGNQDLTGGSVHIQLLEASEDCTDDTLLEMKACEREALYIARRIREMMRENPSLRYRDFAVLTRTKRGVLGKMATVLLQQGIPAFADGSDSYFDSVEILLALNLLKITANRRSDVEWIGVLRSPIVGLDVDQLAQIRIAQPNMPFSDAIYAYAEGEDEIARQLRAFLQLLQSWQLRSLCTDLGVLCRAIFDESGLYDCMGALPAGSQRQANLDQLSANAAKFDQNVSGALTRFLKHCEKLKEKGDGDDAHLLGENDDVVRLMTAHKSKGLEFPVVFGAMMNRRFNARAAADSISIHRDLGLGCLYCDPALQTRRKTLPQMAIAQCNQRQDRAEELRILYVLLTRARDQLILVGSVQSAESSFNRWAAMKETPGAATSYLDVLMPALDMENPQFCTIAIESTAALLQKNAIEAPEAAPETCAPDVDASLLQAMLWKYPDDKAARQPLKLTVTGLLRELQSPDDAGEPLIERPAFLADAPTHMTGAERGTAYHRAMQCLKLEELRQAHGRALISAIEQQLDALAAAGRISAAQREAVRPNRIARFLESETGQRLLHAETVRREWPFNALMRICEALEPDEAMDYSDEEIMVQGSIDCCFLENDRWVLLDYKTDRADDPQALSLRYRNQLRMYALALERITGIPVGEIRLCLIRSGEALEIPLNRASDTEMPW